MDEKNNSPEINIAVGHFLKEKEYWIEQLAGEVENCYFPYDNYNHNNRESTTTGPYPKEAITFNICSDLYDRLIEITGQSYPKIHMVLVAGAATLSYLYTGNRDMIIGTPIERQDTEESLINTILLLRVSFPLDITFKELILQIRKITNDAIENQNYPMETLISERGGLPGVVVLLENIQEKKYIESLQPAVIFSFRATGNEIEGNLEYDTAKYEKDSIHRIIDHFLRLLHIALFNVNVKINDIQLISEEEKKELCRLNDTDAAYPHEKTIHQLFAEQVARTPDYIALIARETREIHEKHITYLQLNEQSDHLAGLLIEKGVQPDTIVAIMMERSIEMIIAIMGILKAGGAYLPIDMAYPKDRIDYMLKDSGAAILLTDEKEINCQLSM
ncbi:MAG: AMP-binding protein, partial [Acidobacteria bacterium]|nr:AMP-binding protein [Acidobacteriota bacterium]